ncbi:class I SAM-dependent methyltransferase [Streptomyces sp. Go40/10]|uniref:methyltransferase domain-containing protein n=1 Tax=Streptomyces sp. Go40/10 TaxID=2825844 RepID=UPI001E55132F|nr:methyltransferase domain-containing protein [Streptomyces sp. Go40/10]UFR01337.1 class I SAM-dependent methyltransferase [Streptomyces sp. Go40/10]
MAGTRISAVCDEIEARAGQWSRALAVEGATVVGPDLSEAQLAAAARTMGAARCPPVQGAAGQLPFAADSFGLVFRDCGGLGWAHRRPAELLRVPPTS